MSSRKSLKILLLAALSVGCAQRQNEPVASTPSPAPAQTRAPLQPPAPANNNTVKPAQSPTAGSDIIATVEGVSISRQDLEPPLYAGYGVNMLAKVAQLKLAQAEARKQGLLVGDTEIQAERARYLKTLFDEDKDPVLRQMNSEIDA